MKPTVSASDEAARKAVLKRLRSHKTAVTDLPDAVIEAKRLGIEITTIAEAAGIARTRVYRILDTAAGQTVALNVLRRHAIDANPNPSGCTDACYPDPYAPTAWVERNRATRAHEAHITAAKPDTEEPKP